MAAVDQRLERKNQWGLSPVALMTYVNRFPSRNSNGRERTAGHGFQQTRKVRPGDVSIGRSVVGRLWGKAQCGETGPPCREEGALAICWPCPHNPMFS